MKYKTTGKKHAFAAGGMINADASGQPQGQPAQTQGQPDQQQQQQPQMSVDVTIVANMNGTQSNVGTVSVKQPEDIKQVVQAIASVFQQQGQPHGGEQPQQPQQ